MKVMLASAFALSLLTGAALAQSSSGSSSTTSPPANSGASAAQSATAQKIKSDLQNAGFKDVNVVAQSFMVQAKTKDGDPVVMTIGPHGMTMLESVQSNGSSGASNSTSNGAASSSAGK